MSDLFANSSIDQNLESPLADKMRPQSLDEVIGQQHLLGEERLCKIWYPQVISVHLYYGGRLCQ